MPDSRPMTVCFGEALLDLFLSPTGSSPETALYYTPRLGGAAASISVILARCGIPSRFVGTVGSGPFGTRMMYTLKRSGTDCSFINKVATPQSVAIVQTGFKVSSSFLGYCERTSQKILSDGAVLPVPRSALTDASWLVTEGLAPIPEVPEEVSVLRDLNVREYPPVRKLPQLEGRTDILKASAEDLYRLGLSASPTDLARLYPQNVHPATAYVVTLGSEGALARIGDDTICRPGIEVIPGDTWDCGDAFTAGMLAYLHLYRATNAAIPLPYASESKAFWEKVLDAGCLFGAIASTQIGATEAFGNSRAYLNDDGHISL